MSKTPRTDQAAFDANFGGTVLKVVGANFARQLETELATAKAKLRKLRKKINEKSRSKGGQRMTFLKVKDGIVNLASIQYIKRVQKTVTLCVKSDFYDIAFSTECEAIDFLCSMYSLLDVIEPEVQK